MPDYQLYDGKVSLKAQGRPVLTVVQHPLTPLSMPGTTTLTLTSLTHPLTPVTGPSNLSKPNILDKTGNNGKLSTFINFINI